MKLKRRTARKKALATIDIAPLIDVVFLLLIFFMLTSSFITEPGIEVNLPRAVTSEAIEEKNIVVTVTSENVLYIDGQVVTLQELTARLRRGHDEEKALFIRADRRASVGRIVEVWDLARDVGIPRVNIATEVAP